MLNRDLLECLCCPACPDAALEAEIRKEEGGGIVEGELRCARCNHAFPIRDGIPDLVHEELVSAEAWQLWQQHLEGFQARRMARVEAPDAVVNQFGRPEQMQRAFADFTGIRGGRMLDVGCGPGKFRARFPSPDLVYFGIDPIPLPESRDFPYLRALAERMPLRTDSLDHVTALAALDHFKEPESFFHEVGRVLRPGGKFHLLQSVHDVHGPLSLLKWLAHEAKDKIEDRSTKAEHEDTPKHMNEYGRSDLLAVLGEHFDIERHELYSPSLLNPYRLFVTVTPR